MVADGSGALTGTAAAGTGACEASSTMDVKRKPQPQGKM